MGYLAGDKILDDEYNVFVASSSAPFGYNHFAGVGSTVYGLGQAHIPVVGDANGTIDAVNWNALFAGIDNIAGHTKDTMTARGQVSVGDTVKIKAAVAADLATLAASVAAGSPNADALATSSALVTVTTGSEGWDTSATQEVKATFANANAMRHFFNAGGKIRITVGATAASVNPKDTSFVDLGTGLGNFDIASLASTRSGDTETLTTNNLARGFQDLTTSYQTIIKLTSDNSNYTSNTIEMFAKTTGGAGASGDATVITVKMVATDAAADTQFTSGNTDGVAVGIKDTPKMVTKIFCLTPLDDDGLASDFTVPTCAAVSNSVS